MRGQPRSVQSGSRSPNFAQVEKVFEQDILRTVRPNSGQHYLAVPLFEFPVGQDLMRLGYTVRLTVTGPAPLTTAYQGDVAIGTGAVRSGAANAAGDRVDIRANAAFTASSRVATFNLQEIGFNLSNTVGAILLLKLVV